MNRRSFITKALAGLAAVPLIGKLDLFASPKHSAALTTLIPTLYDTTDIVSRELVGFIPAPSEAQAYVHIFPHGEAELVHVYFDDQLVWAKPPASLPSSGEAV